MASVESDEHLCALVRVNTTLQATHRINRDEVGVLVESGAAKAAAQNAHWKQRESGPCENAGRQAGYNVVLCLYRASTCIMTYSVRTKEACNRKCVPISASSAVASSTIW